MIGTRALHRVKRAVKKRGVRGIGILAVSEVIDYLFDLRYDVETRVPVDLADLTGVTGAVENARPYGATQVMALRGLFRTLSVGSDRILVDFGSGKGRVLMVAAQFGFRSLRGVEFSAGLCDVARRNIERFRRKAGIEADFEIIHADASKYEVRPDEDVFFLFNSFDHHVLERVLANIAQSYIVRPRPLLLIYRRPVHEAAITERPPFVKVANYLIWNNDFAVFKALPSKLGPGV
jgi:SAM-dependent methyltransferase